MDCFNVIAAAAGGWDKVKLVGIYIEETSGIPAWKLGIYSPNTPAALRLNSDAIAWCSGVLIAPNSEINFFVGNSDVNVHFTTSSIQMPASASASISTIRGTAILFTW